MSGAAATTTTTTEANTTFSHSFEGWSVWLEPCKEESTGIGKEIEFLAQQCGGAKSGVCAFVPHCTLLYNLKPPTISTTTNLISSISQEEVGRELLLEFVDKFQKHDAQDDDNSYFYSKNS